jgi:hypothetical protein
MALIALDIPAPEWPESSIEETTSRAFLNERNEAAPLRQEASATQRAALQGVLACCSAAIALPACTSTK